MNTKAVQLVLSDITNGNSSEVFFASKKQSMTTVATDNAERDIFGCRWQIELGA